MARPIGSQGTSIASILSALRQFPNGTTTRELAQHLGVKPHTIASRLSKAHLYGKGVDREFSARTTSGAGRYCIWKAAQ